MVDQNRNLNLGEWRQFMQEFNRNMDMQWTATTATTQTLTMAIPDDYLTPVQFPGVAPVAAGEAERREEKEIMEEKKKTETSYLEANPELVERVLGAAAAGRLSTFIKERIEEAGGVLVEAGSSATAVCGSTLAMVTDPAWYTWRGRWVVRDGATDEIRMKCALQNQIMGALAGTYDAPLDQVGAWVKAGLGLAKAVAPEASIRRTLRDQRASAVLGEDKADVFLLKAEEQKTGARELKELPKFIVLASGDGPMEGSMLREGGTMGEMITWRWRFAKHEKMFMPKAGRVAADMGDCELPSGVKGPELFMETAKVFDRWALGEHNVPLIAGGWPGVGMAIVQPKLMMRTEGLGRVAATFVAMLIEKIIAFGQANPTPWKEMGEAKQAVMLDALNLTMQGTGVAKGEAKRAPFVVANLDKIEAVTRNELESLARSEEQKARALRRDADVAERRSKAGEKWKAGAGMKSLVEAVEQGKIKAAYVVGQIVWLAMNPIRVTSRKREWHGAVYRAGMYELPELWLCVPMPPRPETIRAFGEDARQHPHPHVYARRGGEICWGRTDMTGEGAVAEQLWGEKAMDDLISGGWGAFAETMHGFFSQFHDDGAYTPLCAIGKYLGTIEEVRGDGEQGVAADPPDGR